jgi:hypothetical protein
MIKKTYYLIVLLFIHSSSFAANQIIGTQAIGAAYHFTQDDAVIEQANRMLEMGSTMIKMRVKDEAQLNKILAMPFDTFFFWWRSDNTIWRNGLSEKNKQIEYQATYNFTKKLLLQNAKRTRIFFIGHWEGDWYLLPDRDPQKNPSQKSIQGMIDWLNIRQQAVDDARRDVGNNTLSKVYHYAEVNRVRDAMIDQRDRVVNKVLPKTNVDYVSYSSYDIQRESQDTINATLRYIEHQLHPKANISGRRVFIGEFAIPAIEVGFDANKHEEVNRKIMIKFLKADVPYILYWEMYNNEIIDGKQQGFWLINDKNQKQALFYTLQHLYNAQKDFENIRDQSINWLQSLGE